MSFSKIPSEKLLKVKFDSGKSKSNGLSTNVETQANFIHLSIPEKCFSNKEAVLCLVKYYLCSTLKSDPCPDR